jgi:hypothetical protein
MKQLRKSQVSSGGREPGFALLLAGVLANGLREWQRNEVARKSEMEKSGNNKYAKDATNSLAQCEEEIRDYK